MTNPRADLLARLQRPQRHRLLNGYPIAPLMLDTPRSMGFLDAHEHDVQRPLIIGVMPHTFCNPVKPGCGFCTFPHERYQAAQASAATRSVVREVETALRNVPSLRERAVPAVYLGGGTANLGRPEDLEALLNSLVRGFDLGRAEVTLEGVPLYFTLRAHAMLEVLGRIPCRQRRISMGVQTLDPAWLARMGRTGFGDAACIAGLVAEARRRGFTTSADLLYNLPGTAADHAIRDLDAAMEMGFEQICVYNLVLSAGMPSAWARDRALLAAMPGNELACATWMRVREHLLAHGFVQRTLTNFERAEVADTERSFAYERLSFDPLRHDALGFGPGAISTLAFANGPTVKWTNVATSGAYIERMSGEKSIDSPVEHHFIYDEEDRRLLALTRGFALGSIDGDAFSTALGITLEQAYGDLLDLLQDHGLIERPGAEQRYRLTPQGMFHADAVVGFLSHRRIAAMAKVSQDAIGFHAHM